MDISLNCGIYCFKNRLNGKVYVGSSKKIDYREKQHRSLLRYGKHPNKHLQNAEFWTKSIYGN